MSCRRGSRIRRRWGVDLDAGDERVDLCLGRHGAGVELGRLRLRLRPRVVDRLLDDVHVRHGLVGHRLLIRLLLVLLIQVVGHLLNVIHHLLVAAGQLLFDVGDDILRDLSGC